jgi:hypothetical protein
VHSKAHSGAGLVGDADAEAEAEAVSQAIVAQSAEVNSGELAFACAPPLIVLNLSSTR